jgi:hypothetical protein
MEKVFVAQNPVEAHLVLGLLEAEGIAAEVRGEALFTTLQGGASASALLPAVWADPGQRDAAEVVLARYRQGGIQAGASWACACGELLEAQFSHCWKCGRAKPEPEPIG